MVNGIEDSPVMDRAVGLSISSAPELVTAILGIVGD